MTSGVDGKGHSTEAMYGKGMGSEGNGVPPEMMQAMMTKGMDGKGGYSFPMATVWDSSEGTRLDGQGMPPLPSDMVPAMMAEGVDGKGGYPFPMAMMWDSSKGKGLDGKGMPPEMMQARMAKGMNGKGGYPFPMAMIPSKGTGFDGKGMPPLPSELVPAMMANGVDGKGGYPFPMAMMSNPGKGKGLDRKGYPTPAMMGPPDHVQLEPSSIVSPVVFFLKDLPGPATHAMCQSATRGAQISFESLLLHAVLVAEIRRKNSKVRDEEIKNLHLAIELARDMSIIDEAQRDSYHEFRNGLRNASHHEDVLQPISKDERKARRQCKSSFRYAIKAERQARRQVRRLRKANPTRKLKRSFGGASVRPR